MARPPPAQGSVERAQRYLDVTYGKTPGRIAQVERGEQAQLAVIHFVDGTRFVVTGTDADGILDGWKP